MESVLGVLSEKLTAQDTNTQKATLRKQKNAKIRPAQKQSKQNKSNADSGTIKIKKGEDKAPKK
jgi:hypothetical protein